MFKKATEDLKQDGFINCSNSHNFINSYLKLSDEAFLNELNKRVYSDNQKIIEDLLHRRLWKRIAEVFPKEGLQKHEDIAKREKILGIKLK